MNRHQHPSNNDILGAPPGVPIEECNALPITRVIWRAPETQHGVVSYWLPTAAELQLINNGKAVRLCILGRTHAPLMVGVDGDGEM